jgi:hypothetical protein
MLQSKYDDFFTKFSLRYIFTHSIYSTVRTEDIDLVVSDKVSW